MPVLRKWMALAAAAVLAMAASRGAWSQQAWRPEKAVEFIVPTAPGGFNDQVMRLVQKILHDEKLLTVPGVIMNRPGGNQTLAAAYVTQRAGDAHYLMYTPPPIFTNQLAGISSQHYTDFTPLVLLLVEHTVVTVRANSPIRNMRDLVDRLRADPESISFGIVARGGPNHLAVSQAVKAGGFEPRRLKAVVFKTNAESITATIGGHIQAVASSASAALPQLLAGNTRVIAIAAPQRAGGALANVPTLREQGIDANGLPNWRSIFGPRGLTPAQIAFWEEALARTVATAEWRKLLEENSLAPQFLRHREFLRYLEGEYHTTKALMTELGLVK